MATYLEYLSAAMRHAKFERLESGKFFATIPELKGLWAAGDTEAAAKADLYSALDGWLDVLVKVGQQRPPVIDGVDLFAAPKRVEK